MENPWLSVVIPSHNGERWLSATLQSLVDQEAQALEVILIDSSQGAASLDVARAFGDRLSMRIFQRRDLVSWTAKTNFGVEQARTKWICMLHQDDLWLRGRLARLGDWLSRAPDAAMHLHPCFIVDETGRRLGTWRCPFPADDTPVGDQLFYKHLLVHNSIGIPTPTIRRDAYLAVGGLDNALWFTADWDLYLKLAGHGDVFYHNDVLACFRIHRNSLTVLGSKNLCDFRIQHQIIIDRHLAKLHPWMRSHISRLFRASLEVNSALAAGMDKKYHLVLPAIGALLALGPRGIVEYFHSSRIIERLVPRMRAVFSGRY
jgi:glycosyltransferase involved in cell wall biosynthesis